MVWLVVVACAAAIAQETGPIGLDSVEGWDQLPILRPGAQTWGASSHARDGGNGDAGWFLYQMNGENVLMDATGPGCVYRIWFTGQDPAGRIRMYFDNETTPRVDMVLADFFSGTVPPFLHPLVVDDDMSSGGFCCDVPLPFAERLIITTRAGGHYYNIGCHKYPLGTPVQTFTGEEDISRSLAIWENVGKYPGTIVQRRSPVPVTPVVRDPAWTMLTLEPGASRQVLACSGPQDIYTVRMRVPGLSLTGPREVTDDGRAHLGYSEFTVAIAPTATAVTLVRRLDYGIGNQKATVSVDGQQVGTWFDQGVDWQYRWRDSEFGIPAWATAGKSQIRVRTTFVSSDYDWNEFTYWVRCKLPSGDTVQTDVLDVRNSQSEATHAYVIDQQSWEGIRTFYYPPDGGGGTQNEAFTSTWIHVYWEGEPEPSISIPLGYFFGCAGDPAEVRALPFGIGEDGCYFYFPMPFERSARIVLENRSAETLRDLRVQILTRPLPGGMGDRAHLRAVYAEGDTVPDNDWIFLDTQGRGHVVGIVHNFGQVGATLEGDERVYVDGSGTPRLYGTGTEDFYSGGWYFNRGIFTLQTHGLVTTAGGGSTYRLFLADPVSFTRSIRFGIEHGPVDDVQSHYSSVALWYGEPEPGSELTDVLDVSDAGSESAHGFTSPGSSLVGPLSLYYEGDYDTVPVIDSGRAGGDYSVFRVSLDLHNQGAILRRRMDYGTADQVVAVYVGASFVGYWYTSGSNTYKRWRDDEFLLPAWATAGKPKVRVWLAPLSGSAWNAFRYEVYSLVP
jgi:hypothetical protein